MNMIIKKIKKFTFLSITAFVLSIGAWKAINAPISAAGISAQESQHIIEVNELYKLAQEANQFVEKASRRAVDFMDKNNNTPYRSFINELSQDIQQINTLVQRFREMSTRQGRSEEYHNICSVAHRVVQGLNETLRKFNQVLRENQNKWTITLATQLQKLDKELDAQMKKLATEVTTLTALACKFDHRLGALITAMRLQLGKMATVNEGRSTKDLFSALQHRHKQ